MQFNNKNKRDILIMANFSNIDKIKEIQRKYYDVADKVVFDLSISFLSENHHNGKDKRNEQHEDKDDCRYHKPHTRIDIRVQIGEVNLHDTHL